MKLVLSVETAADGRVQLALSPQEGGWQMCGYGWTFNEAMAALAEGWTLLEPEWQTKIAAYCGIPHPGTTAA